MSVPLNVERDEITTVATVFETTAEIIGSQADAVAQCGFDGRRAGRNYAHSGTAIHGGYQKVAAALQNCATQSHDLADTLRGAVAHYGASDQQNASDLGGSTDGG